MNKVVAIFAVVFSFSGIAQAGILFEPYVGYEAGSLISTDASDVQNKYTNTSTDAGLRLGIRNRGFWMAAEGLFASGGKSKPVAGEPNTFTGTTLFVSMGYDFLTRIRLHAGYGLQDSVVITDTSDVKATYYGGFVGKAGLGYYLSPHMAINAEYVLHDFKKYKINGVEHSIADAGFKSLIASTVLVTLSFPITF